MLPKTMRVGQELYTAPVRSTGSGGGGRTVVGVCVRVLHVPELHRTWGKPARVRVTQPWLKPGGVR